MSSGVQVAEQVNTILQEMKVNRSNSNALERIRLLVLEIGNEIDVVQTITQKDLEGEDAFKVFCSLMSENKCRYIVYDCHYETNVSKKEDLVFVMWAHEKAPIKQKMLYASSKRPLAKISEAKYEFEIHDMEDLNAKAFAEKVGKNIVSLENQRL